MVLFLCYFVLIPICSCCVVDSAVALLFSCDVVLHGFDYVSFRCVCGVDALRLVVGRAVAFVLVLFVL